MKKSGKIEDPQKPVALVASTYYEDIINGLIKGAKSALLQVMKEDQIHLYEVPGALELPLVCQKLAQSRQYAAIIALGAVIRGGTAHFDVVVDNACRGLADVSLSSQVPVLNAVLTVDNALQAMARSSDDQKNKGCEAAEAALKMASLLESIT